MLLLGMAVGLGMEPAEALGLLDPFPCPPVWGDGGGSPLSSDCSETGSSPSITQLPVCGDGISHGAAGGDAVGWHPSPWDSSTRTGG